MPCCIQTFLNDEFTRDLFFKLCRRSVSTLLSSGFRESLDQLIHSYIERQGHGTRDIDETMPPYTSAEQEQEHNRQSEGQAGSVESHSLAVPVPPTLPSRQLWDHELSNGSWPRRDFHQQFGAVCLFKVPLSF